MDGGSWQMVDPVSDEERDAIGASGGLLTVDLAAIRANYRLLAGMVSGEAAGVVKANGYGLGGVAVARALMAEGCRRLFVAHLDEALVLRAHLSDVEIIVLHGATPGAEATFLAKRITPVLNTMEQVAGWRALARGTGAAALLQVDTGMSRFGLPEGEFDGLVAADGLGGMAVSHVMSHLACADEPGHSANAAQLAAFRRMRARLPQAQASLSATSGIWLGPDYHFDLVRPGAGLYGVAPHAGRANPMRPVVRLQVRVMQVREVPTGTFVGYGHTDVVKRPSRLATISAGYADGFMRGIGPRGAAWIGDSRLPVIGRVSMDSTIVDATDHAGPIVPGMLVELLGTRQNVDDVAAQAGTIGYEILTGLGGRYARRFIG